MGPRGHTMEVAGLLAGTDCGEIGGGEGEWVTPSPRMSIRGEPGDNGGRRKGLSLNRGKMSRRRCPGGSPGVRRGHLERSDLIGLIGVHRSPRRRRVRCTTVSTNEGPTDGTARLPGRRRGRTRRAHRHLAPAVWLPRSSARSARPRTAPVPACLPPRQSCWRSSTSLRRPLSMADLGTVHGRPPGWRDRRSPWLASSTPMPTGGGLLQRLPSRLLRRRRLPGGHPYSAVWSSPYASVRR